MTDDLLKHSSILTCKYCLPQYWCTVNFHINMYMYDYVFTLTPPSHSHRKPGQVNLIKSMSAEMDKGNYDFSDYGDIHTVGSLLKKFFKELPDPAVPAHLYDDFVACAKEANDEDRLSSLKELVFQLPTAHYHTLKFLMRHLKKVASHSDENKVRERA